MVQTRLKRKAAEAGISSASKKFRMVEIGNPSFLLLPLPVEVILHIVSFLKIKDVVSIHVYTVLHFNFSCPIESRSLLQLTCSGVFKYEPFLVSFWIYFPLSWYIVRLPLINFTMGIDNR